MSGLPVKNVGSVELRVRMEMPAHTIEIIGNPNITFQLRCQVVRHNLTVLQGQPKPICEEHYGTFRFQVLIGGWSEVGALKVGVDAPCGLTG